MTHKNAIEVSVIFHEGQRMFAVPKQPAPVREDWGPGPHEVHSLPPAQPAPTVQEPLMVDMHPPATQRDRWMYEQGRLAERDPRSHPTPPAAPVPLTEPQRKAIYDAVQGMDVMKAILMTEAAHGITAAPEKGQL